MSVITEDMHIHTLYFVWIYGNKYDDDDDDGGGGGGGGDDDDDEFFIGS
jgi:hypothetical protein